MPRTLLEVEDVLYHIFSCLSTYYGGYTLRFQLTPDARLALLALATSCKLLSRHALDALWNTLPNDEPLRRLLDALNITVTTRYHRGNMPSRVCIRVFVSQHLHCLMTTIGYNTE